MKPEELRIGNYIQYYEEEQLKIEQVTLIDADEEYICEAISLTEEWLEDFNFKIIDDNYHNTGCGESGKLVKEVKYGKSSNCL